jgi:hypothetical protein
VVLRWGEREEGREGEKMRGEEPETRGRGCELRAREEAHGWRV